MLRQDLDLVCRRFGDAGPRVTLLWLRFPGLAWGAAWRLARAFSQPGGTLAWGRQGPFAILYRGPRPTGSSGDAEVEAILLARLQRGLRGGHSDHRVSPVSHAPRRATASPAVRRAADCFATLASRMEASTGALAVRSVEVWMQHGAASALRTEDRLRPPEDAADWRTIRP
jgi:hypothetical protein